MTQGGRERELTVDEALQLQTYQAALKGSRMAVRTVLKMIEKREAALAKRRPATPGIGKIEVEHDANNADEALRILGIAVDGEVPPGGGEGARILKLATWAAQAGLSRPGRRALTAKERDDIKRYTFAADKLRWPRGKRA